MATVAAVPTAPVISPAPITSTAPTADTGHSDSVTPISELILDRPPSCIQFVPGFHDFLVVGTYQLESDEAGAELTEAGGRDENEQSRSGTLRLIRLSSDGTMRQVDIMQCASAIYDLHFLEGESRFAAVSSTGTVSFYTVEVSSPSALDRLWLNLAPTLKIVHDFDSQVLPPSTIITYFDFMPTFQDGPRNPLIAASTNDGGVYLMKYDLVAKRVDLVNSGRPVAQHMLKHSNVADNAWCCTFYSNVTTSLYSGGDNAEVIRTQLRIVRGTVSSLDAIVQQPRTHAYHDAGVTAILPLTCSISDDFAVLLTGSYDDHVRVYHTEFKKVLAELDLGGGVYRLKLIQEYCWKLPLRFAWIILACCMHAGTKILEVRSRDDVFEINVVGSLNVPGDASGTDPANYCYAADGRPGSGTPVDSRSGKFTQALVSGSFVDKKLTRWDWTHVVEKPPRPSRSST